MANSIVTNSGAQAAIRSLFTIDRDLKTTQGRIESGLKVNKASDDPAVFSIAQGIRGNVSGLKAVQEGLAFGSAVLGTASKAASKISDELNELKKTITQGQQQGLDKDALNTQVERALSLIDTYASSSTYMGVNLMKSETGGDIVDTELTFLTDISGRSISISNQQFTSKDLGLSSLDIDAGGVRFNLEGVTLTSASRIEVGGKTFEFTNDEALASATSIAVSINGLTTQSEIKDKLASTLRANGLGARVNKDGSVDVFGAAAGNVSLTSDGIRGSAAGTTAGLTYDATNKVYSANQAATASAPAAAERSDAFYVQILGATAVDAESSGTGETTDTSAAEQYKNVKSSAIATVDSAITLAGQKLATIGAIQRQVSGLQEFTKTLSDTLNEGLGALVDADMADESARLQALQTRQQLAIQSLSIANQQPQALLGLFR
ncbi:flagellin [Rhodospirillum centenum]|uniref:Flagellin n=1 Tax=Rhodospirillum centenum (strain ATCC 51521 / SW) TaxID=414684 RepID=B6IXT2_RHOCS|nr:flagellin [Rhodospirillum centenum]ACJ01106.1 flagellar protein Laf1 (LafA or FlaB) [Rhodospirillum centenum SW]